MDGGSDPIRSGFSHLARIPAPSFRSTTFKVIIIIIRDPLKRRPREEESLPSFAGLINYSAVGFLLLPPLALPSCLPFILHWICISHYRGVRSSSAEKNASSVHTNHPFISRGGSATVQEMPRPTNRGIKPVLHTIHNTTHPVWPPFTGWNRTSFIFLLITRRSNFAELSLFLFIATLRLSH